mmetsp:Transcript_34078/g.105271  ORF Transcript_34078/g.105271 Transcript_34078/m.105271 type:complete len:317 (-) Transcript_34078:18-968(-)
MVFTRAAKSSIGGGCAAFAGLLIQGLVRALLLLRLERFDLPLHGRDPLRRLVVARGRGRGRGRLGGGHRGGDVARGRVGHALHGVGVHEGDLRRERRPRDVQALGLLQEHQDGAEDADGDGRPHEEEAGVGAARGGLGPVGHRALHVLLAQVVHAARAVVELQPRAERGGGGRSGEERRDEQQPAVAELAGGVHDAAHEVGHAERGASDGRELGNAHVMEPRAGGGGARDLGADGGVTVQRALPGAGVVAERCLGLVAPQRVGGGLLEALGNEHLHVGVGPRRQRRRDGECRHDADGAEAEDVNAVHLAVVPARFQ